MEDADKNDSNLSYNQATVDEAFCRKSAEEILRNAIDCEVTAEDYAGGLPTTIVWKIVKDSEYLELDPVDPAEGTEDVDRPSIDWEGKSLGAIFFDHFLPDITGHAKIIDKYHSDPRSSMHHTYKHDQIQFHDDEAEDPDWIVKQCYLLLVAAVGETQAGMDGLWRQGFGDGRRELPNFGHYMPVNYFKSFKSAAPYCWTPERYWYQDRRDGIWELFLPCLKASNHGRGRSNTFTPQSKKLVFIDESMSGWRPKTSKFGGLPNNTFESRKPVPLGAMLRNSADCITGCLLFFQDVVMTPEHQEAKEFLGEMSHLPTSEPVRAHTAEVLRQVGGAKVPPGGWVGGDSWFGSVATAVEVFKRFQVHSTWIIKTNLAFYPKMQLKALLRARYPTQPQGHWVVMHSVVSNVPLMAIAYAWSQTGIAFFLSTCGTTKKSHHVQYVSKFVGYKVLPRPQVCHLLYEYLPIIDEHNRQRQNFLALEKCWPSSNCWFRLLTTLVGQSLVDLHRMYRHYLTGENIGCSSGMDDKKLDNTCTVINFCNRLCGGLKKWETRLLATAPRNAVTRRSRTTLGRIVGAGQPQEECVDHNKEYIWWERIPDKNGSIQSMVTNTQVEKHGRAVGTSVQQNCWVCRKYTMPDGTCKYNKTSFRCRDCKRPICINEDRSCQELGRMMSCKQEHRFGNCPASGCVEVSKCLNEKKFPAYYKRVLAPFALEERNTNIRRTEEESNEEEGKNGEGVASASSSSSQSTPRPLPAAPRRTNLQNGAATTGTVIRNTRRRTMGMTTRNRANKRRRT